MGDNETRAMVEKFYDAYGRRDLERVAALLHDDIDWIIYSPMTIFPFAGHRRGRAAVLQAMTGIAEAYLLEKHNRELVIIEGDRAAVILDLSFRQRATDRTLRFRIANFLRFQDGQVIRFREFANTFDVVEQALGRELPL